MTVLLTCNKCNTDKPVSDFHKNGSTRTGYLNSCRDCNRKTRKSPTKAAARGWELKRKYGISVAEYEAMFADCNGLCEICGRPESRIREDGQIAPLSVDHCHTTGKVRGLLCAACNYAIGFFNDTPEYLRNAADYLEKSRGDRA